MSERIIVRTIQNISYAGKVIRSAHFESIGLVLQPNKLRNMEIFIPENEIQMVITNQSMLTYGEFKLMM